MSSAVIATSRFMIHGIVKGSDAEADQPMFDRLAGLGERVEVRQEVLASGEYLARLAEADLLLLPYDPDVYRRRGSGVFADAHHVGIPVVAPKECAFARPAFEGGWGVAMKEYDGTSLGIAVLEALDRLGLPQRLRGRGRRPGARRSRPRPAAPRSRALPAGPRAWPASCADSGRDLPQDLPKFGSNPGALSGNCGKFQWCSESHLQPWFFKEIGPSAQCCRQDQP